MHLEEFAEGKSLWHRMDPRVKLTALLAFAIVTATSTPPVALITALALGFTTLLIARLDSKKVLFRLMVVNGFVLFIWLFLPFTTPGEEIARIFIFPIKREGIEVAGMITMKTNAIVAASIGLIGTSSVFSLVHALTHLYVPQKLVQLFFFCYRYISVIHEEFLRLSTAIKLRAFRPGTNTHTYKTYAYMLGMLFVRSFERSERIYQAMVLRGFSGTFYTLDHIHMRPSDWVALTAMLSLTGVIAILQWGGIP